MEPTRLPDPFAIQTDPQLYVPRRATEEALDALERGASLPHAVVCFTGPPGLGKTLLLHVLAAELAPHFRTAYLPYARLPAGGVWTWAAKELALEPAGEAKEALRRFAGELAAEGRALLLEIDDASSLPAETLAELTAFARAEPGLRVVLAFSEGEGLAAPLPGDGTVVRLDQPMSRAETQDYVKGRLERCAAPRRLIERFDTATVARLHRESQGNPLRVHGLAIAVVRGAEEPAAAVESEAAQREPAAESPAPPPARAGPSAAPPQGHGEPTPSPQPRAEAVPSPQESAERMPLPPEVRAHPRKRPVAPRARARSPSGARSKLGRVLSGAAGLCIGLVVGVALGRWGADWAGLVARGAHEAQVAAPVAQAPPKPLAAPARPAPEPAPRASAPEPAPSPAVAAAPPPTEPAQADVAPSGGEPAPAAATVQEATPHEGEGEMARPDSASRPPEEAGSPPLPDPGAAPQTEGSAAQPAEPARSEPAPREGSAARLVPSEAPLAEGRLAIDADAEVLIEIDGRAFGAAPLSGIRLRRGPHRVIAYYRDGGVGQKTVHLGDEDVSVTFR